MRAVDFPTTTDKLDPTTAQAAPAIQGVEQDNARRAVAGILELSKGITLGGFKIKDLINEGRP
jgi:hypothetical protein